MGLLAFVYSISHHRMIVVFCHSPDFGCESVKKQQCSHLPRKFPLGTVDDPDVCWPEGKRSSARHTSQSLFLPTRGPDRWYLFK